MPTTASMHFNESVSRDSTSVALEVIPTSLAPQESNEDFGLEKRTMTWDRIVLTNACVCIRSTTCLTYLYDAANIRGVGMRYGSISNCRTWSVPVCERNDIGRGLPNMGNV